MISTPFPLAASVIVTVEESHRKNPGLAPGIHSYNSACRGWMRVSNAAADYLCNYLRSDVCWNTQWGKSRSRNI